MTTSEKLSVLQKEIKNGTTILSTAIHEAGHAVVRCLLKDEHQYQENILSLSVYDKENGNCEMKSYRPTYYALQFLSNNNFEKNGICFNTLERQFQKYAMVNFAGYRSEFKYRNILIPCEFTIGNDYNVVNNEIGQVNSLLKNNYYNYFHIYQWNAATDIIIEDEKVWATIEELANILNNSMKMDSNEIYKILDKNLKDYKLPDNIFDSNYLDEYALEKFMLYELLD